MKTALEVIDKWIKEIKLPFSDLKYGTFQESERNIALLSLLRNEIAKLGEETLVKADFSKEGASKPHTGFRMDTNSKYEIELNLEELLESIPGIELWNCKFGEHKWGANYCTDKEEDHRLAYGQTPTEALLALKEKLGTK